MIFHVKNCTMKLSWLNIFREYAKKLQIKSRIRIVLVLKPKALYYQIIIIIVACYYHYYCGVCLAQVAFGLVRFLKQ